MNVGGRSKPQGGAIKDEGRIRRAAVIYQIDDRVQADRNLVVVVVHHGEAVVVHAANAGDNHGNRAHVLAVPRLLLHHVVEDLVVRRGE